MVPPCQNGGMTTGVAASRISAEVDDLVSGDDLPADCWNADVEDAELLEELEIADRHRRQLMAHQTMLVAEAMRRGLYRTGGHSSVFGLLRARLGWSEGECRDAVALVRAGEASASMQAAVDNATLPVSHATALARSVNALAQSSTADHGRIDRDVAGIVADHDPEHDQFSKSVRRWETIVDPARSQRSAEVAHDRRDVAIRPTEHGVTITARWGAIDGARAVEAICGFADAEHETDRRGAVAAGQVDSDGHPVVSRTAAQCRADGLVAIIDAATAAAPGVSVSVAPVSVLVDERTFTDTLAWFGLYPKTAHDPFSNPNWSKRRCETSNGIVVDPATAVREAIAGHPPLGDGRPAASSAGGFVATTLFPGPTPRCGAADFRPMCHSGLPTTHRPAPSRPSRGVSFRRCNQPCQWHPAVRPPQPAQTPEWAPTSSRRVRQLAPVRPIRQPARVRRDGAAVSWRWE